MAVGYNPRAITDGLVLALDAQNSKSWKSGTTWTDTIGGNNGTLTGGTSHSDGPFPEAGYVEFDGSTEYLSIADSADFDCGTGDWTIEGFVYHSSIGPYYPVIISNKVGSFSAGAIALTAHNQTSSPNKFAFSVYDIDSGNPALSASTTHSTNVWYHIAVVRNGTTLTMYRNGESVASRTISSSVSFNFGNNGLCIGGGNWDGSNSYLDGFISNLRVIKGTALYTSDFTPPSSPLTAVTNTTLLCCQGGTNVDASPSAHSFQVIIGVPTLTSVGPSASKYFEFDGSNDYVTLSSSQIAPGTGAFTWNFWAKHIPTGGGVGRFSILFSGTGSNTFYGVVFMNSDTGLGYYADGFRIIDSNPSFNDEWWYITFVGNGGASGSRTLKLYRNGVQAGSTYTYDYNFTSTTPIIGANHSSFAEIMRGNISNVLYYNRELTELEIQQNYNALKGRYA